MNRQIESEKEQLSCLEERQTILEKELAQINEIVGKSKSKEKVKEELQLAKKQFGIKEPQLKALQEQFEKVRLCIRKQRQNRKR